MWKSVTYRCVGSAHTRNHSDCQDAVFLLDHTDWIVAALSDGLGSLVHSHIASQSTVQCVCDFFGGKTSPDDHDICAENIVPLIRKAITDEAQAQNLSASEMDCTLAFAAIDKKHQCAYVGVLGDSAVCVIGKEQSTVYSDTSISANGTFTVMGSKAIEQLQIKKIDLLQEQVLGFILTSDGLEGELYTKGSTRIKKAAEYYFNSLAGGNDPDLAYQLISQRIDKLTIPEKSTYDDDISLAVLSCAEQPITLPADPTWLCTCGYRNSLQNTYCKQCRADFIRIYPNIKFREYGGKAAFFTQLNQDPLKESEMVAASQMKKSEGKHSVNEKNEEKHSVTEENIQQPASSSDSGAILDVGNSSTNIQGQDSEFSRKTSTTETIPASPRTIPTNHPESAPNHLRSKSINDPRGSDSEATYQAQVPPTKNRRTELYTGIGNNPVQPSSACRWIRTHFPVCVAAVAGIIVILLITVSIVSNHLGYNKGYERGKNAGTEQGYSMGFATGVQNGREQALTELQTSYDDAILQAQQDYNARYLEHYQAGYEQGKMDATFNPQYYRINYRLKRGNRGNEVRVLQQLLSAKGWNVQIDGNYGPGTEKAVCEFQKQNNLPETGEVDILTYWALLSDESVKMPADKETSPSPIPTGSEVTPTPPPPAATFPTIPHPTVTTNPPSDEVVDEVVDEVMEKETVHGKLDHPS